MSRNKAVQDAVTDAIEALFGHIALGSDSDARDARDGSLRTCPRDALYAARPHVLDLVACDIALILRRVNNRAPIQVLPTELLAQILSHASIHDRFSATRICHSWRQAVLDTAYLWADMRAFGSMSPCLPLAFRRAKEHAITLDVSLFTVPQSTPALAEQIVLSCIQSRLSHIRSLHIEIGMHDLHGLNDALSNPAPILEDLSLRVCDSDGHYSLRDCIFDDFAPRLQHLALIGLYPPTQTQAFSAVRSLQVRALQCTPARLAMIHAGMPQLEEYSLQFLYDYHLSMLPASPPAPAPALRAIHVDLMPHTGVLDSLPHVSCPRLAVHRASDVSSVTAMLDHLRQPSHVVIRITFYDRIACLAADSSRQRQRLVADMRSNELDLRSIAASCSSSSWMPPTSPTSKVPSYSRT